MRKLFICTYIVPHTLAHTCTNNQRNDVCSMMGCNVPDRCGSPAETWVRCVVGLSFVAHPDIDAECHQTLWAL